MAAATQEINQEKELIKKKDEEFEPGAAQFGNFINYYEFNPPRNRLALFEGKFCDFFPLNQPLVCLDVGCNTGVCFSQFILNNTVQFFGQKFTPSKSFSIILSSCFPRFGELATVDLSNRYILNRFSSVNPTC